MLVTLHVTILILTLLVVVLADEEAFQWITGRKETLDRERMATYHRLTWVGLIGMILSGLALLLPRLSYLAHEPLFIIKMLFVGILVTNAVLIGRLAPLTSTRTFASLTSDERLPLLISGAISTLSWAAVVAIGFYLFL